MIPKIIHYCWFGGNPLPELAKKCIDSWKKYCPDYEIIEWNETNFDYRQYRYAQEAYEAKKWAFVSDVARLYAMVNYGGVYMDTDVEVLKPLDDILEHGAVSGFEAIDRIPTGLMACQKGHPLFSELLEDYNNRCFIQENGEYDLTTNVTTITNICLKHGLILNNTKQTIADFTLFPCEYFCPKDSLTKITTITDNTYTIHHFDGSWVSDEEKYTQRMIRRLKPVFTEKPARYIAKFFAVSKYRGVKTVIRDTNRFLKNKLSRHNKTN